jgi:hypothetical protein
MTNPNTTVGLSHWSPYKTPAKLPKNRTNQNCRDIIIIIIIFFYYYPLEPDYHHNQKPKNPSQ